MSLKIATIDDLNIVYNMVARFASSTDYKDFVDEEKLHLLVQDYLNSPNEQKVVILHGLDGMIAGAVVPFVFGTFNVAAEAAWWVEPKARNKKVGEQLISAFEAWGKKLGCKAAVVSCLDDKVAKFYEKNDYKLYERAYLKVL